MIDIECTTVVSQFMEALQVAERSGDLDLLVELFTEDAELSAPRQWHESLGREGVREFWRERLCAFERVESRFTSVIHHPTIAALEWSAEGTLPSGRSVVFEGVTLMEFHMHHIQRLRMYYDSADLAPTIAQQEQSTFNRFAK